jgi:hypothetical protein
MSKQNGPRSYPPTRPAFRAQPSPTGPSPATPALPFHAYRMLPPGTSPAVPRSRDDGKLILP